MTVVTVLKSATVYFGLVFGAGFVFGVIRNLWVVPRVGVMWAELLEAPLMLAVIVVAARWTVRRFDLGSRPVLLAAGTLALAFLLFVELTLVLGLRGMSFDEYIASRDPVSGTVYLVMLIVFALMPLVVAGEGKRI
jgi:hypothetical protein